MQQASPKFRQAKAATASVFAAMLLAGVVGMSASAHAADAKAGDAAAGRTKAAMCIGCHQISGYKTSFPEVYHVPKIAGQNAPYIVASLQAYQKGERRHPSMRGIAIPLTEQDMADLAAFYQDLGKEGRQASPDTAAAPPADVARILEKGACASCHGANFNKPIDPAYPKLAGQYSDYLYAAVRSYLTENNNLVGRSHAIMGPQLKNLQVSHGDLRALSNYLATLPSEIATVQESGRR